MIAANDDGGDDDDDDGDYCCYWTSTMTTKTERCSISCGDWLGVAMSGAWGGVSGRDEVANSHP